MKNLNRGFTAVELMIVIAIMGIMLTMAMPSFVQFTRNSRIKSGAQIVVSALRTARSYAITKRKRCTVFFNINIDGSGYMVKSCWLVRHNNPDYGIIEDAPKYIYTVGETVMNWKALPKTITMAEDSRGGSYLLETFLAKFPDDSDTGNLKNIPSITFNPMGAAVWSNNDTNTKTVEISDGTGEITSYIEVQKLTGRIKTSR